MAMRRAALAAFGPSKLPLGAAAQPALGLHGLPTSLLDQQQQQQPQQGLQHHHEGSSLLPPSWLMRSFASAPASSGAELSKPSTAASSLSATTKLSLSPTNKITYNELNHARFEPGTEGRPMAYFVQTGGRFLYASAIRLAVLKAVVSLSAAADTLAMSSLEVDLSGVEEGQTITVKWRGKPVFIRHRTEDDIALAAGTPLTELKDPQADAERVVDPKYLIVVGVCTHLGCVPIAGAGNYQGWFCPCHGSHYDGSGRAREGPAPYNLEVPEYRFTEGGSKVVIG